MTIVNVYAPNTGLPGCLKTMLRDLKRDVDSNTIIMGDFNTPLSALDRSTRQINEQRNIRANLHYGTSGTH